jgi:hypothetical protein
MRRKLRIFFTCSFPFCLSYVHFTLTNTISNIRISSFSIAENDQTETIVCTYNQNTYTLLYKLQRRDESKEQSVNITYLTIFHLEKTRLCHESLPPKHRRTIFTETFKVFAQLNEYFAFSTCDRCVIFC